MAKPSRCVKLEKRAKESELARGFMFWIWTNWKTHKRYDSESKAIQAHEGLIKSSFYRCFEWRIVSPMGTILLK